MISKDYVKGIIQEDRKTFFNDLEISKIDKFPSQNNINLIADFTEYSPLHNGHFHCMKEAKHQVNDSIFVAIVPGLFERSGRGLPYILHRKYRGEIAISVGADIVVEGPPMGIMGSGQYSLCLAKMFKSLNTDFIPRGYKKINGFDEIMNRISTGHAIAPKPYKIVDMDTGEIVLKGKLEEDNYVIVSLSKSLNKVGFDFKDKFIFVERITGVSGTLIREAIASGNFDNVKDMMPKETIEVLKREIADGKCPLHNMRFDDEIINNANNLSFSDLSKLNFFNENYAQKFIDLRGKKAFDSIDDVKKAISRGFSTHFQNRVLSILETNIEKNDVSKYIDQYPSVIRVIDYKNKDVLDKFREKIGKNIVFL
ncbi:nucleotidyltransferase family protein [Methanobrevibacter sp. DSM 116169]|uniref:nucleotidyltransferase family protein n=1 Tax=Methanobrevibacter sp. DSM 116169 TaxID=3242727 RepID=UPI0038FCDA62